MIVHFLYIFSVPPLLKSSYRFGVSYDEGYPDERLMPDDVYNYPPGHKTLGALPHSRRQNYDENYPRELRRQEKPYIDSNYAADYYHDSEVGSHNGYRDHEHERSSRYDGREDSSCRDYNYRSRNYHHNREDSRDKDYDYARRSYDSDYERGSVRDGNRKSRDPQDRERDSRDRGWDSRDRDWDWDKRCFSRERDESPHKRYEKSRSRSTGRGEFSRSRSPRGRSHGRSYRENSYEGDHWHESERRREYEDRHDQDHFCAVYIILPSLVYIILLRRHLKKPFLYFYGFC